MNELGKNIQDFVDQPSDQSNDQESLNKYSDEARDLIHSSPEWKKAANSKLVRPTMRQIEDKAIKDWQINEKAFATQIDRMFDHQPITEVGPTTKTVMKGHYSRYLHQAVQEASDKDKQHEPGFGHYGLDSYKGRKGFDVVLAALDQAKQTEGSQPYVLDIGCAVGELLGGLKQEYPNVRTVGVDLFDYPRVSEPDQFVQASADCLPKEFEGRADVVTSARVLEYALRTDVAFDSLVKTLAPGGTAYVEICYVRPQVITKTEINDLGLDRAKTLERKRYMELISGIYEEKGHKFMTDDEKKYLARWIEQYPVPNDIRSRDMVDFYTEPDFTPTSDPRIDFEKLVRLDLICKFMELSDSPDYTVTCLEPEALRNDFAYIPPYLIQRKKESTEEK